MLGRSHAVCGLIAGVGIVAAVPSAPWPVKLLTVGVAGGAALLPDLDTKQSTAARSLGLLTGLVARLLVHLSVAVYQATKAAGDSDRQGGHRLLTHTLPGCLLAGGLFGLLAVSSPVSCAVSCALLFGLLGLGLRTAGFSLAALGGVVSWIAGDMHPGWSWLVGVAVSVGCLAHVAGDVVTVQGVPLLWPLKRGDQRWGFVSTPGAFTTGTPVETAILVLVLCPVLLLSTAWVTGLGPVVYTAVSSVAAR